MADRFSCRRFLTANRALKSHKDDILPDSVSESNHYPLQYLKGVGPARARTLAMMGILQPADLAAYYPRDWEDRRLRFAIGEAPVGQKAALRGTILSIDFSMTRSQLGIATVTLEHAGATIQAVWFKKTNMRYDVFSSLRRNLQEGKSLFVWGMIEWGPGGRQIRVEDMSVTADAGSRLEGDEVFHFDRIVPAYTVPESLHERLLRALIGRVLSAQPHFEDPIPPAIRRKWQIRDKRWAIQKIHFPDMLIQKEEARQVLAFEEFLILETALGLVRRRFKQEIKPQRYHLHRTLLTPFREGLGFEFTSAQKRVIREIFADMMEPQPMNRLLQGDVGSGKTLAALSAMLLAVENGGQAVLMAPTEILAEQHALTLSRFLEHLPVKCALLTGRQTAAQRRHCLKEIAEGHIHLVIGTHALVQQPVQFASLQLVVIDEQHRFGVEHRRLLREKGVRPDILVMTATPIPRTLALTLYGDLDVSVIDELPPGRTSINSRQVAEEDAYRQVQDAVRQGRQAYIVYPLVTESDKVELKAVTQEAAALSRTVFKDLRVGVLHGQLPGSEKKKVMEQFRRVDIDVLIATSIIEVGIDVPNATLMVIQHAERFGLSTLHQLRGRVGRSHYASTCLLVADTRSEEARRRIEVMTEISDGFRLSEEDLKLRGPGEVMGVHQHGMPTFKLGNLVHDARLIQRARLAAGDILARDPSLSNVEHRPMKQFIQATYSNRWSTGLTG
jgi:ATP-dependent DNA helicase RecG